MTNLPEIRTISESRPLARTPHICTVCGLPIAIGSTYDRILLRDMNALNPKRSLRVIKWHLPHCPAGEPNV